MRVRSVWWWLCVVGSLLLEHTPSAPTRPSTKDKRLGQRACIGRVAQGQRGDGMRALGVFENWAGKFVFDFDLKRPTATLVATDIVGYRKSTPSVRAYASTHSSKPHPRAPPPDPRLNPRPVFVASGGVIMHGSSPKDGVQRLHGGKEIKFAKLVMLQRRGCSSVFV